MKHKFFLIPLTLMSFLVLAPNIAWARSSGGDYIRCESIKNRPSYCSIPGNSRVYLQKQLSQASCVLGRSWGYSRGGVWVKNGCRGLFAVSGNRANSNRHYGYRPSFDGKRPVTEYPRWAGNHDRYFAKPQGGRPSYGPQYYPGRPGYYRPCHYRSDGRCYISR